MRKDAQGNDCPSTLGEYRDLIAAIMGADNEAVKFLDEKIAAHAQGRDEEVIASDEQMRRLLFPMMLT